MTVSRTSEGAVKLHGSVVRKSVTSAIVQVTAALTRHTLYLLTDNIIHLLCFVGVAGFIAIVQLAVLAAACSDSDPMLHPSAQAETVLHHLTVSASSCADYTVFIPYLDCCMVLLLALLCCLHAAGKLSALSRLLPALSAIAAQHAGRLPTAAVLLRRMPTGMQPNHIMLICNAVSPQHGDTLAVHRTFAGAAAALTAARQQLAAATLHHGDSHTAEQCAAGMHAAGAATAMAVSPKAGIAAAACHLRMSADQVAALDVQTPRCVRCVGDPMDALVHADATLAAIEASSASEPSPPEYEPVVLLQCVDGAAAQGLARRWNAEARGGGDDARRLGAAHAGVVPGGSAAEVVESVGGVLWGDFGGVQGGGVWGFEVRFWAKATAVMLLGIILQGVTSGADIFKPSATDPRGVALGIGESTQLPPLLTTFRVSMILATVNSAFIRLIQRWCAAPGAGFLQSAHRERSAIARAVAVGTCNTLLVWLYMFGEPGTLFWLTYATCSMVTYPCIIALRVALNGTVFVWLRGLPAAAASSSAQLAAVDGWAATAELGARSGASLLTAQLGILASVALVFSHVVPLLWLLLGALLGLSALCYPRILRSSVPDALLPDMQGAEVALWHCMPLGVAVLVCARAVLVAMTWPSAWGVPARLHGVLAMVCAAAEAARQWRLSRHACAPNSGAFAVSPASDCEQMGRDGIQLTVRGDTAALPPPLPNSGASALVRVVRMRHPLCAAYNCLYNWVGESSFAQVAAVAESELATGPWWGSFCGFSLRNESALGGRGQETPNMYSTE